ncbi:hypothetical protein [Flavipsychrobacter stenotrophus]|uniref:hypothetical protein n=1 Tax=Flavipsychrobacter stenotrophus TaxID=2077091 RepID=UPI001374B797|nr:hypothetical protein [Flavipsychrobacter stenotrophus]
MSAGQLKAIVAFYRYYCVLPVLLSMLCCYLFFIDGSLFAVLMIKLITGIGVRYFIILLQSNKLFYYYNQHMSRTLLWGSYFLFDLALLIVMLCLISLLK